MNADDRAPAGDGQQSFAPRQADAAPQREGFLQASSQVPQRSAFRPVTGTQAQGSPASAAQPGSVPPAARPAGGAPFGVPVSGTVPTSAPGTAPRPAFSPSGVNPGQPGALAGAGQAPVARPSTGTVPQRSATVKPPAKSQAELTATGAPRKVRVLLARVDPWSVLKIGFLLSIAAGIMLFVAVNIIWNVLNTMGIWTMVNDWVNTLFNGEKEVKITDFVKYPKVMSATTLIAVVNVVLITGLSVVGAFLYNVVAKVVGGVYLTLTDD